MEIKNQEVATEPEDGAEVPAEETPEVAPEVPAE